MDVELLFRNIKNVLEYQEQELELQKKQGLLFNIFDVLNVRDKETRHSAFIAELLNPQGSHGQDDRFLRMFMQNVQCLRTFAFETKCANAKVEEVIQTDGSKVDEGGRMDIVIHSKEKVIILENKIYAGDQYLQLARYSNYAQKYGDGNFIILYLTLGGGEASQSSTKNGQLQEGKDYFAISYAYDISRWLEDCTKATSNLISLNSVIKQYHQIIKNLTNTNMDSNNKILDLMFENNTSVLEISKNLNSWRTAIKEAATNKMEMAINEIAKKKGIDAVYNEDTSFYFVSDIDKRIHFSYSWEGRGTYPWYYGVYPTEKNENANLCKLPNMEYGPTKDWPWGWNLFSIQCPVPYYEADSYYVNILTDSFFQEYILFIERSLELMINDVKNNQDVISSVLPAK